MIDNPDMVYRTTKEWKEFLRLNYAYGWDPSPPDYWYVDRFWQRARDTYRVDYAPAILVYEGRAYFWKNPILQIWEVVQPPESKMLDFMFPEDKLEPRLTNG